MFSNRLCIILILHEYQHPHFIQLHRGRTERLHQVIDAILRIGRYNGVSLFRNICSRIKLHHR